MTIKTYTVRTEDEFEAALTRAYDEGYAVGHDDGYQEGKDMETLWMKNYMERE